jgi:hypothetical protein
MPTPLGPQRRQVSLRIDPKLLDRVDQARGTTTRDVWLSQAAEAYLKPKITLNAEPVPVPEPELDVVLPHEHEYDTLIRTEWRRYLNQPPMRMRTYQCLCGAEHTESVS